MLYMFDVVCCTIFGFIFEIQSIESYQSQAHVLGIRLSTSNQRNSGANGFSYSFRSSITFIIPSIYCGCPHFAIRSGLLVLYTSVMSATPRSFYIYSSFQLLRLTGAFLTTSAAIIPTCVQFDLSYFWKSYKTHIFNNASLFSYKLASTICQGFNVPHLIHLFITKIQYHHAANNAIAVKIGG